MTKWFSRFFQYTEIKTKITSISAFLLCTAYFLMRRFTIQWLPTLVFFLGMLMFDLTTTSINNYIDSRTDGTVLPYQRRNALMVTIALLVVSAGLGIWLVALSDLFILVLGGACFACGIFYTFGPVPISRLPLGEVLSGLFYGFFIPWIFFYINLAPGDFMLWQWQEPHVGLLIHLANSIALILLSVAPFCCTANIMLANNLCDMEKDLRHGRRTLPSYIGKKFGLALFAALAIIPYLSLIVMALGGMVRPVALLALLSVIPVARNIRLFMREQNKAKTFPLSLKNYLLTLVSFSAALIPGAWL